MDRDDRLELIALLHEETAKARAELERRAAEREADPALEQDWLMADEPRRSPPVRKSGPAGIMHRDAVENAPAAAPVTEELDWSAWERWMRAHLKNERADLLDFLAMALGDVFAEERAATRNERAAEATDRNAELAKLQIEIDELRGQVNALTVMLAKALKASDIVELMPRGYKPWPDRRAENGKA